MERGTEGKGSERGEMWGERRGGVTVKRRHGKSGKGMKWMEREGKGGEWI